MGKFNLSHWAIRHPQLIAFLILVIGDRAARWPTRKLGRAEDPSFTIKNVNVSAVWPGATAAEMQGQVADRIEKKLQELPFVDKIETYSKPELHLDLVRVQGFDAGPRRADAVPAASQEDGRPEGRSAPRRDRPDDQRRVRRHRFRALHRDRRRGDLRAVEAGRRGAAQAAAAVADVTKVDLYGDQGERIFVEFSHAKLATLGLSVQAILDSLAKQNALVPAGEFQTDAQRVPLRVSGAVQGVAAVEETPVMSGGQTFRLGDIATVTHGYEDPPSYLIRAQGQPALEVGVVMQKGGNILALGKALDATLAEFEADVPQGIVISRVADQPKVVGAAVFEFTRSFLEALAIVLGVSFVCLGWRSGLVVATSVPLVLAIVFVAMTMLGLDLQRVTLGALIIALGLLVDDAIIATETIVVKLEQGWDRERAASFAWTSTAFPMLTGTLVTAAGFMPIGLANSATGEYAGGIFWVVGIALVASWFVAVLFTPFLGFKLLPNYAKAAHRRDEQAIYATPLLSRLPPRAGVLRLAAAGRHRASRSSSSASASASSARCSSSSSRSRSGRNCSSSFGSPRAARSARPRRPPREAEKLIAGDDDASSFTTYIGKSSPRFWLGLQPVQPNESFAQIVIVAKDVEARERIKARIEAAVAKGALSQARVRVDRFNFGPPVGFPVQFRVTGPEVDKVREIAGRGARRDADRRPRDRSPSQLGREDAVAPLRRRSGARAGLRADAAGYRAELADADRRRDGHDDPRRRGADRRGGARGRQRTGGARPDRAISRSRRAAASRCRSARSRRSCARPRSRSSGGATANS